jgi:hypothetical protein
MRTRPATRTTAEFTLSGGGLAGRGRQPSRRKFRNAGLICLGKTNTPELGLAVTTEPAAYGPSRNPWNPSHSSGGSAAAVASGMVPAAHASDGGGSIRIPASECGLVGLKPSRGRVSLGPAHGEYWAGLVISCAVTRSVRDTAAMLDAICEPMTGDPYVAPRRRDRSEAEVGADPGSLRLGVLRSLVAFEIHEDCRQAVEVARAALEQLSHRVEESQPAALDDAELTQHFLNVVTSWTAAALNEWGLKLGRTLGQGDVEPSTRAMAELGRTVTGAQYVATLEALSRYTRQMASWWSQGFDVLVLQRLPLLLLSASCAPRRTTRSSASARRCRSPRSPGPSTSRVSRRFPFPSTGTVAGTDRRAAGRRLRPRGRPPSPRRATREGAPLVGPPSADSCLSALHDERGRAAASSFRLPTVSVFRLAPPPIGIAAPLTNAARLDARKATR